MRPERILKGCVTRRDLQGVWHTKCVPPSANTDTSVEFNSYHAIKGVMEGMSERVASRKLFYQ